jgi:tripartite-type tricarboxylate transporter receptor subunit TctC
MDRRSAVSLMLSALAPVPSALAQAAWPDRPIRMVVPFPPGGSTDPIARIVGQKLGEALGQSIVVDNRPGGNTSIGAGFVSKAAPDGYTLLFTAVSTHVIHTMQSSLAYDSVRDFTPIATVSRAGYLIVVHPSMPATLPEFIAYAKANPGKLNYASAGIGNANHLGAELFNMTAGVKTVHVPYKGGGAALQDLVAGRVQFMVTTIPTVIAAVESGQLRALAFSTPQAEMPQVPTFTQHGLSDFEKIESLNGIMGPPGMPPAVVQKLSGEIEKLLKLPDVAAVMLKQKQSPFYLSPAQFGDRLRADQAKYAQVIKTADIKLNP